MEEIAGTRDCGVLSESVGAACGETKQDSVQAAELEKDRSQETEPGTEVEATLRVGSWQGQETEIQRLR